MSTHPSARATDAARRARHRPHRAEPPSPDVALLAATALGFAYLPADVDDTHTSRLASLARLDRASLSRAQDAVLTLRIGSAHARRRAAALLRDAARSVAEPGGAARRTATAVAPDDGRRPGAPERR